VEPLHVDDGESSRDSMDSVMFTEGSSSGAEGKGKNDVVDNDYYGAGKEGNEEAQNNNNEQPRCNSNNDDDRLWCHETQLETVSDCHHHHNHRINISESSLLDFMAMKHANAGGKECLKIQIAGGIIGERYSSRAHAPRALKLRGSPERIIPPT